MTAGTIVAAFYTSGTPDDPIETALKACDRTGFDIQHITEKQTEFDGVQYHDIHFTFDSWGVDL